MTDQNQVSQTDVLIYVAEMAEELAQLAGSAQSIKLVSLLEAVAREARHAADPPQEGALTLSMIGFRSH